MSVAEQRPIAAAAERAQARTGRPGRDAPSSTSSRSLLAHRLHGAVRLDGLDLARRRARDPAVPAARCCPTAPRFENYAEVWRRVPFALFFRNTLVVTVLATVGAVVSATLVAYGFARVPLPRPRPSSSCW